jgi:hypothetical protein
MNGDLAVKPAWNADLAAIAISANPYVLNP